MRRKGWRMETITNLLSNNLFKTSSSIGGLALLIILFLFVRNGRGKIIRVASVFIGAILLSNIFGLQDEMIQLVQLTISSFQYIVTTMIQIITYGRLGTSQT